MRFESRVQDMTYVVVPSMPTIVNGRQINSRAIRAKFRGGVFDSDMEARYYRWTDEEKEQVERYLLDHWDFERQGGYFLAVGEDLPPWYKRPDQMEAPKITAQPKDQHILSETCVFRIRTSSGSEECGKKTELGPYCKEHGLLAGWEEEKPKRKAAV